MNPGKLSIRSKLFLLATSVAIFWLLGGFILISLLSSHSAYNEIAGKVQSFPAQLLRMENALHSFYLNDQSSLRFQEEGASASIEDYHDAYLSSYGMVRNLSNLDVFQKDPIMSQKLDNLMDYLRQTNQMVGSMQGKSRQRGWGSLGIAGLLNRQLDQQEIITLTNLHPDFMELTSTLKVYLVAPTSGQLILLQNLSEGIKTRLNEGIIDLNPADAAMIHNFIQQVNQLLSLDRELGISKFDGLQNQIFRTISVLYEETDALATLLQLDQENQMRNIRIGILITILITVFLVSAGLTNLGQGIRRSLKELEAFTASLILGKFPRMNTPDARNEFSEITSRLNQVSASLKDKSAFSEELAEGKEGRKLTSLSKEDRLANALNKLEKNLEAARREELKHQHSREQRRWSNEGIAGFGEILRIYNNDIYALAENVIQELVVYLKASAGGFFLTTEEDTTPKLDLIASFAFERKKYLQSSFRMGEGLIGTCAIEKEKIFLTQIPNGYINISSGMGESDPRCLLLVPLKLEEQVLGIIELASLSVLEPYEVELVENLAGSIASAVATVKMNMRTTELLQQSQEQAKEMSRQEEIMRQNMEVLQATQEESARRESEISGILNAIHNSSLVAEFNTEEELISINDKFLQLLSAQRSQLIGKKYHEIVNVSRYTDDYKLFWQEIREGKTISRVDKISPMAGDQIWLRHTLTPILDKDGQVFKVLNIATDITESVEQQESLEKQSAEIKRANLEMQSFSDAVDSALIKCVYSASGQILEVNSNYEQVTGFTEKEQLGKNNRTFLQRAEKEQFEKIWEDILKHKPYSGVTRRTKPTGEETWLMSSFTPVADEHGNVFKVFFLGQDITERKLKYQLLEEANKEIDRLRKQIDQSK